MVKRLRLRPLTAATRVRIPVESPQDLNYQVLFTRRTIGGTGRRAGFRFLWETVGVRVPYRAPYYWGIPSNFCIFLLVKGYE